MQVSTSYPIGTIGWELRKDDSLSGAFADVFRATYPLLPLSSLFLAASMALAPASAVPTYGLWAGPGWNAGSRPSGGEIDWATPPCYNDNIKIPDSNPESCYSLVDATCKTHDWRYDQAEKQYAAGLIDESGYKNAILQADKRLLQEIANALDTGSYTIPPEENVPWDLKTFSGCTFDNTEKLYLSGLVPSFIAKIATVDLNGLVIAEAKQAAKSILSFITIEETVFEDPSNPSKKTIYSVKDGLILTQKESASSSDAWIVDLNSDAKPVNINIVYGAGSTKAEDTFVIGDGDIIRINSGTGHNEIRIAGAGSDTTSTYTFEINDGGGNDTYYLDGKFNYTLNDTEANGIFIEDDNGKWKRIGNLFEAAAGTWKSLDEYITLTGNAITLNTGNTIEFNESFEWGDFGINLLPGKESFEWTTEAPETNNIIIGDLQPIDFNPDPDVTEYRYDTWGNIMVDSSTAAPNRSDTLYDTPGNDAIYGLGGSDHITLSRGGDNLVFGGEGNNYIYSSSATGNNIIEGGAGNDYIQANGGGNDKILGGDGNDTIRAFNSTGSVYIDGGEGNDHIYVNRGGRQWIIGGNGSDYIDSTDAPGDNIYEGGADNDAVLGGSGNDEIFCDDFDELKTIASWIADGESAQGISGQGDMAYGGDGYDDLYGSNKNDLLIGGMGIDLIIGGGGDDHIIGDSVVYSGSVDWFIATVIREDSAGKFYEYTYHNIDGDFSSDFLGDDDIIYTGAGNDVVLGGAGNDEIYGGTGADTIFGEAGHDFIEGGDGDDLLIGDNGSLSEMDLHGDDYIDGGDGHDHIEGQGGNDDLFGGAGNDTIFGGDGDDYLDGEHGEDMLYGNAGNDVMIGGSGNDTLFGGDGDDYLDGESGENMLYGGAGNDMIFGGDGNDWLQGDEGDDYLDGGSGNNTLLGGDGDDALFGGGGDDHIQGDAGNDYIDGGAGNNTLQGGAGNDDVYGGADADFMQGDAGDDFLDGGGGNDHLLGGEGNDTLFGGAGDDHVQGDAGDDYLDGGAGNDYMLGMEGNDTIYGGDGNDSIWGGSGNDSIYGEAGNDQIAGEAGDDYLDGGAGNDLLDGGAGNDTIFGGDGADQLQGGAGDDYLHGGTGDDVLLGGAGNDTYRFGIGDGIDVIDNYAGDLGATVDVLEIGAGVADVAVTMEENDLRISIHGTNDSVLIRNWFSYGYMDQIRFSDGNVLTSLQLEGRICVTTHGTVGNDLLIGSNVSDTIYGYEGNDRIYGGGGTNLLDGGPGNDWLVSDYEGSNDTLLGGEGNDTLLPGGGDHLTMLGGSGDDVYRVGRSTDIVIEYAGEGFDTVYSDLEDYTLPANVEKLDLDLYGHNGTGNELDNLIMGSGNGNWLKGEGGNDTIYGMGSHDTLEGGAGDDYLDGDYYDWTYYGSSFYGDDYLDGGEGNDVLMGGYGNDTYIFGRGYGHDIIYEDFKYGHLYNQANNFDTIIIKGDIQGIDVLLSRKNDDLILNIIGTSDQLTVSGWFRESGENVVEQIQFEDGSIWDMAYIRQHAMPTATDGDDTLTGTAGPDRIEGLGGNDYLSGLAGDDTLDGGPGADTLYGGPGDDTFIVDHTGDVVIEYSGEGIDTIKSSITRTLSDHVENLKLTGAAAINGTGNSLDNYLTGNVAANTLTGHAGNDTLDGGAGNDSLVGGTGNDTYLFGRGSGQDTILDNDSAAGNLDKIILAADIAPADVTVRRSGDHLLVSNSGATDTLTVQNWFASGGAYRVEQIVFSGSQTIWDEAYILANTAVGGTSGNDLLKGTSGPDHLSGLAGNDTLYGYEGDDTLDGGTGADSMIGGNGDDTYIVDNTSDKITETSTGGMDTVFSSVSFTLPSYVENLTLTGSNAINGTGNTRNNRITGNAGANTLRGGSGKDTLDGGAGNDSLTGGSGSDTYIFRIGSGKDTVNNCDTSTSRIDTVRFVDVSSTGLRGTRRSGKDLILEYGISDSITIKSHYSGRSYQINRFTFSNGVTLSSAQLLAAYPATVTSTPEGGMMAADAKTVNALTDDRSAGYENGYLASINAFMEQAVGKCSERTASNDASWLRFTEDGTSRLNVSDGYYVTRQDIEAIVNTMSAINNDTGMDVMQKYNAMMQDQAYIGTLSQSLNRQML